MSSDCGTKALVVPLDGEEQQELLRILIDGDEAGALGFLQRHLKPALHKARDGGLKGHLNQTTSSREVTGG